MNLFEKFINLCKKVWNSVVEFFKTVWAKVSNLYGKEFIEAQKVEANISKKFIIRYIKDLDPSINPNTCKDFIITYRGISYDILYIDNIKEENKFMEVMAGVL